MKIIHSYSIIIALIITSLFLARGQQYPSLNVLQHSLGGSGDDRIIETLATSDGYYVLAGYSKSSDGDVRNAHGFSDFWVVKINGFTGDTVWTSRAFGGSQFDELHTVFIAPDGHYVLSGTTSSADGDVRNGYGNGLSDIWVVKLNSTNGDSIWTSRALGGSGNDEGKAAFVSLDGKYVIAGGSSSANGDVTGQHGGIADFWILTLDPATGNPVKKSRAFGGNGWEFLSSAFVAPDGHYVLAGYTTSTNGDVHGAHGNNDFWVVKIDSSSMDTIWTKTLGGSADDLVTNAFAAPDGNYVLTGYSRSSDGDVRNAHGNADLWVVKLNATSGDTMWTSRALGGSLDDGLNGHLAAAFAGNDGNYFFISQASSLDGDVRNGHGTPDIWVAKLDAFTGDTLFTSRAMGGNFGEEFNQIMPTCDGGWLLSADTYTKTVNGDITQSNFSQEALWIVKTDSLFNIQWDKIMSDSVPGSDAENNHAFPIADGGFLMTGWSPQTVIAGNKTVTGHGSNDFWTAKMKWIEAGFSSLDTVCTGTPVSFIDITQGLATALPGVTWQWDFGDGNGSSTIQNPQYTYTVPGTYTVMQIVNKECQWDTVMHAITVLGSQVNLGNDSSFCYPDTSYTLDAGNNGISYQWSTGDTASAITISKNGEYYVQVADTNGCVTTDTINLSFNPLPEVSVKGDTTVCAGVPVELTAPDGGFSYRWNPGNGLTDSTINPAIAKPNNTTIYYVTITDTNNCINIDTTGVMVIVEDCGVYFSNSFSPGGDGLNDTWMINSTGLQSFIIQIYNHLGQKVFETTDINIRWDGKNKEGEVVNEGVYVYYFDGVTTTGAKIKMRGNVTIVN